MTETFTDWTTVEPRALPSGVRVSAVTGDRLQVVRVLVPGTGTGRTFASHSHPQEQFSVVLEGVVEFSFDDGESAILGPGGVVYFAPHRRHGVRVISEHDVVLLDVYTPPRRDYTGEIEHPDQVNPQ